jgi:S-adenosylmethionine synthetase
VRKARELDFLLPDGKTQVTVEYEDERPVRIDTIIVSSQHTPEVAYERLREGIIEKIIKPVVPRDLVKGEIKYYINPTGRFVLGGPYADSGVTGRKIIVDTYGGFGHHGGGCFSGKDPTKVDRTASYYARYVAKNLVAAGVAAKVEIQLAYAIGVAQPVSVHVTTFGTGKVPEERIAAYVMDNFDMRPRAMIEQLNLRRPIYKATAAYGHFGREEPDFTWERCDRCEKIKADLL